MWWIELLAITTGQCNNRSGKDWQRRDSEWLKQNRNSQVYNGAGFHALIRLELLVA